MSRHTRDRVNLLLFYQTRIETDLNTMNTIGNMTSERLREAVGSSMTLFYEDLHEHQQRFLEQSVICASDGMADPIEGVVTVNGDTDEKCLHNWSVIVERLGLGTGRSPAAN